MMTNITAAILCRKDHLPACQIDDEIVLLDVNNGMYLGMNAIAASIWTLLEKPLSFTALCQQLMIEYDVAPQQCEEAVTHFLIQLTNKNLIEIIHSD